MLVDITIRFIVEIGLRKYVGGQRLVELAMLVQSILAHKTVLANKEWTDWKELELPTKDELELIYIGETEGRSPLS